MRTTNSMNTSTNIEPLDLYHIRVVVQGFTALRAVKVMGTKTKQQLWDAAERSFGHVEFHVSPISETMDDFDF